MCERMEKIVINDDDWMFVKKALLSMQIQSDKLNAATEGLLIDPESPLLEPQYITEKYLIESLQRLVNDPFENISWFVYECDYGRKSMDAGCKNNMKRIDSIEKLKWLLELDCNT